MYEASRTEGSQLSTGIFWTVLVFGVPLAVVLVTSYLGGAAFFWGLLIAVSLFGILFPLALSLGVGGVRE